MICDSTDSKFSQRHSLGLSSACHFAVISSMADAASRNRAGSHGSRTMSLTRKSIRHRFSAPCSLLPAPCSLLPAPCASCVLIASNLQAQSIIAALFGGGRSTATSRIERAGKMSVAGAAPRVRSHLRPSQATREWAALSGADGNPSYRTHRVPAAAVRLVHRFPCVVRRRNDCGVVVLSSRLWRAT